MTARPMFDLVDLVASDYDATLEFYRRLGIEVHDGPPGDIRHAPRVVLGFRLSTGEEVDERYEQMTNAGYAGAQPRYDTFWGARYAAIIDPDGIHIGLMSPTDNTRAYWPPDPAPVA